MTIDFLDQLTMWLAFVYGLTMFFVLEVPWLKAVEKTRPEMFLILRRHQPIALFCLWFGAVWILQDLYLAS
ncbi:MAG: hypothetical protein K2Q26_09515 [Bdellovibrionales bacterium]|nr:hypothetical protein [Bdellovibrionales bacterium]